MSTRPTPVIHPTRHGARLDRTVYAVNLLRRKRPWAYDLYSLLAFPVVRKAGGQLLLKGDLPEPLRDGEGERDTVLIVAYPSADHFLSMVRRHYFVAISLFRRLGLSDFLFGFTERLDDGPKPTAMPRRYHGSKSYLLGLIGESEETKLWSDEEWREHVEPAGGLLFAGRRQAILALDRGLERGVEPTSLAPPLPYDGVFLCEGVGDLQPPEQSGPVAWSRLRRTL